MRQTSLQDRETIHQLARAGVSDPAIARQIGWTLATVRKWRRRAQRGSGPFPDLSSPLGRPPSGALGSFPETLVLTLREWRHAHPGWGPATLLAELERLRGELPGDPLFAHGLPSAPSLARWLRAEGLTRTYQRHGSLPTPPPSEVGAPHQQWELDARGHEQVPGVGVVSLIQVNDAFSRARLLSYPCLLGDRRASRRPGTLDYQLLLREAFTFWGLPDRLKVDHEHVFFDNASVSPFPTRLHLWLGALGVELTFGRKGHPTDQGMTERSHQLWDQQVLQGARFPSWEALKAALDERRTFLNEWLPCSSVGGVPPLVACPQARLPRREYRPEWEEALLDLPRVEAYLAQGHLAQGQWFRRVSCVGTVSLGNQVYGIGSARAGQGLEVRFDLLSRQLLFRTAQGEEVRRHSVQGLSGRELMGEMGPLVGLRNFQLALPFSPEEWRIGQLCQALADTTL